MDIKYFCLTAVIDVGHSFDLVGMTPEKAYLMAREPFLVMAEEMQQVIESYRVDRRQLVLPGWQSLEVGCIG